MRQSVHSTALLVNSIPQHVLCVKHGTLVEAGATPRTLLPRKVSLPKLSPPWGHSHFLLNHVFLLNLLQLEGAVKAFLPSPSSETLYFSEASPGLTEQIRAWISVH